MASTRPHSKRLRYESGYWFNLALMECPSHPTRFDTFLCGIGFRVIVLKKWDNFEPCSFEIG